MTFQYVDLFAGIGGMRIPFDEIGGECVFTSEKDPHALTTYQRNFKCDHEMNFDITSLEMTGFDAVPDHDLLLAGFPCQPFSSAGLRGGFEDTRGTLFFYIVSIIRKKKPRVVLLENVKGLRSHENGKTIKIIIDSLSEAGYLVHQKVLNARDFGLPQNRNRLFLVALRNDIEAGIQFEFPSPTHYRGDLKLGQILENSPDPALTISDRLWEGHLARRIKNKREGKGFGFQMFTADSPYSATLSARYFKDGSEILIEQFGTNPRKLSVSEAKLLQGFPHWFNQSESKIQAYKQFGNAVPVPVVRGIAASLKFYLSPSFQKTS